MLQPVGALRTSRRALAFLPLAFRRAAIAACALLAACGDDNGLLSPASIQNTTRVFSVYALTGTSSALPAAYQFTTESLARPQVLSSGGLNFDVAFDLTADNRVRLLPARQVVPLPPNLRPPTVGLLKVPQRFPEVQRAPDRGYVLDSAVVLGVGETYVLELYNSGCIYQESYFAKLAIDSILPAERRIVVRSLVNRNCGYRSLAEGLPAN